MEWIERLNSAVNYIEENLTSEIDMDQVAKIACCSTYHFQRMFAYMADVPLSEYIRRRRMSLAAVELQDTDNKVIDIALKYGYDSPTAFNRAFKSIHGIAPSQIKNSGSVIKAFPPIGFRISIKGDCEMNYRMEKTKEIRIVGVSMPLEKEVEKNFEQVPMMWGKVSADGTIGKIASMMNTDMKGILGVSCCNDEDQWRYYIAAASTLPCVDGLEEYTIPESQWAVFSGEGTGKDIQNLERRIVTEWLPTSGYEYGNAPDIEVYLDPNPMKAKFEVWIPVVRKEM